MKKTQRLLALLLALVLAAGLLCTGAAGYVDPAASIGSITVENDAAYIDLHDGTQVAFTHVSLAGTVEVQGEFDPQPVTLHTLILEQDCLLKWLGDGGACTFNLHAVYPDGHIEGTVYSDGALAGENANTYGLYIYEDGSFYLISIVLDEGRYWITTQETVDLLEEYTGLRPTGTAFTDVSTDAYYYDAVVWAVENGVTVGTSATTFSPADTVTRSQTVTFLWRAAGEPEPAAVESPFTDVTSDEYYYKAVLWAVEQGITYGVGDGRFDPEGTLAYDEILAFLCRAAGVSSSGEDWSQVAVNWAAENGLTDGLTFGAKDACPRADVVYCLWKQLSGADEPGVTPPEEEEPTEPVLTEQAVYDAIVALKGSYPEGMHWTNDDYYSSEAMNRGGYGCEAFALICSDTAFGDLPVFSYFPEAYSQEELYDMIRVGDMLRINESHTVVVLEKHDDYIVITEGNYNSSIHWGRTISRSNLESSYFWIRTRYPAA